MDEKSFKKTNWEDWEIDVLKVLKTNNVPPNLIAKVLNRSHNSINIKTAKLGFKSVLSKDIDDTKELEDLKKAAFYLDRKIKNLEK
jgi:hypothetical protein